jgi:hypothetical protein
MSPGFGKASIVVMNVWCSMKTEARAGKRTLVFLVVFSVLNFPY